MSSNAAKSSIEEMDYIAHHENTALVVAQAALRAKAELEANAAEIGRLREALEEVRTVLMAHGFGVHSVTIAQIDAALNKQESGNV
jgi:hypothetical protein